MPSTSASRRYEIRNTAYVVEGAVVLKRIVTLRDAITCIRVIIETERGENMIDLAGAGRFSLETREQLWGKIIRLVPQADL
jgi:hypothetical protein